MTPNVLCVIPARGGSLRVPGKNVMEVCGRAMIEYTWDDVTSMETPHDTIVVTDDDAAKEVSHRLGIRVVDEPLEWASAEYEFVAIHEAASIVEKERGMPYEIIVIAYACCPIRPSGIFDRAIVELRAFEADVVQSMCRVPTHLHPYTTFEMLRGGDLREVVGGWRCLARTQDLPPAFAMSSAAVALSRSALERHRFSGIQRCARFRGVFHDPDETLDVDTPEDLEILRKVLEARNSK